MDWEQGADVIILIVNVGPSTFVDMTAFFRHRAHNNNLNVVRICRLSKGPEIRIARQRAQRNLSWFDLFHLNQCQNFTNCPFLRSCLFNHFLGWIQIWKGSFLRWPVSPSHDVSTKVWRGDNPPLRVVFKWMSASAVAMRRSFWACFRALSSRSLMLKFLSSTYSFCRHCSRFSFSTSFERMWRGLVSRLMQGKSVSIVEKSIYTNTYSGLKRNKILFRVLLYDAVLHNTAVYSGIYHQKPQQSSLHS